MNWEFLWLTNFLLSEADHLSVHWLTSWVLFDELFVHFYCLKKNWNLLSTCVWACACCGMHVEVTGQLWGASFLLLPCEFQEGLVASPLSSEPSCCPLLQGSHWPFSLGLLWIFQNQLMAYGGGGRFVACSPQDSAFHFLYSPFHHPEVWNFKAWEVI